MGMSTEKKGLIAVLKKYGVRGVRSIERLKEGFANRLYQVTTKNQGSYVLKIVIRNNPKRVQYEVTLLNFLQDLPTPKPMLALDGTYLKDYGKNKVMLYPFLPGTQQQRFSKKMLYQIGEFLGKLHLQTRRFRSNTKRIEYYSLSPQGITHMKKQIAKSLQDKEILAANEYMAKHIPKHLLPPNLPSGAMHIDLKPENTLFLRGKLTGVVDFDNSYNGPLVLDLAKAMQWFATKNGTFYIKRARLIYQGYITQRKLSKLEEQWLFSAIHFSFLSHVFVDTYYLAKHEMGLPKRYIIWLIKNMIRAEKHFALDPETFKEMLFVRH